MGCCAGPERVAGPGGAGDRAGLELRIARSARDRYAFAGLAASTSGDAIVVDSAGAAAIATAMAPGDGARRERIAVEVAALGLLHELGHRAIGAERRAGSVDGGPIARALATASTKLGAEPVIATLTAFEQAFPPSQVYRGEIDAQAWLARTGTPVPAREAALEELVLTWVALRNPAAMPYRELLDDSPLVETPYPKLVDALRGADVPIGDPAREARAPARALIERLLEPARAAPQSLAAQLRWIRSNWGDWLAAGDLASIEVELSRLDEVEAGSFLSHRHSAPDGITVGGGWRGGVLASVDEPEAFSDDRDWMAELVLVAKSTYVWLAQLSRQHGRGIWRLDQVPDEELDELRARGFTGLWLIGIWERSQASREIKQRRGNPDAMASAYSVSDYRIADELGGEAAWRDLRDRAAARGLRLAADMVPNHMALDSPWVVERPDLFISSPYPPFEAYRYEGPDLSRDDRVVLQIEDHYWDSSDAAVTFRRVDRASGETRYVYHGNDGTSFPWNDTAQLDYLRAEVREAVIGQVLEVARRFPVIRFDAAMVLAKRHVQRLWYPLPGQEAGIPSRTAAALPADEFERRMPLEFWREVVDRVATEAPDTLLLAEAFWLLEGYFVRSLGMHRVYNSAFMHMLRDERNGEYQQVIRETVAFDARILGRYVNFMSNPDERSAIDQFGRDDKYVGVATLLATLPGLPMFGHGQVEGYTERYGMEFRRPMRDETPDEGLVARHRRDIFPLLHQRWRFAGASSFRLLTAREGDVEVSDVFAYANEAESAPVGAEERRSLVVYLNRYPRADVRIEGVASALGLDGTPDAFVILHDHRSGLDHLRELADLRAQGLRLSMDGYRCFVFLAFEIVSGPGWRELAWRIGLEGVSDAHAARRRLVDEPLQEAVRALFVDPLVAAVLAPASVHASFGVRAPAEAPASIEPRSVRALDADAEPATRGGDLDSTLARLAMASGSRRDTGLVAMALTDALERLGRGRRDLLSAAVAGWLVADAVGTVAAGDTASSTLEAYDAWQVGAALGMRARALGQADGAAWRIVELARALLAIAPGSLVDVAEADGVAWSWLEDDGVRAASGWNEWQGRRYVRREAWDELLAAVVARDRLVAAAPDEVIRAAARRLEGRMAAAGYEVTLGDDAPIRDHQSAGEDAPPPADRATERG
jgi:glycosidase